MKVHPIIDNPLRWGPILILGIILVVVQVAIIHGYTGIGYFPVLIDGCVTIGWLLALGYLAWFVVGVVSIMQTRLITMMIGILVWLAGCFVAQDIMVRIFEIPYISFASTIPFRLLFGVPTWISILLWYHLMVIKEETDGQEQDKEVIVHQSEEQSTELQSEILDRITVKDGSRIHLITVGELLYIQACGDYVTLVTPTGEYIKEQTMKYFDSHLPSATFVRIHRSTIVNVTCISRVELFGKETYQLLLKNGVKLRVSLSGYKMLKERLGI